MSYSFSGKIYPHIQVIKFPWCGDTAIRMKLAEDFVDQVPAPELPYMPNDARAAFCAVLQHEQPPGNGSVNDTLLFAQARGFYAHPADWIPCFKGDNQFPSIYQPMVSWLAENEHIPFFEGVPLTDQNMDAFSPNVLRRVFLNLIRKDRKAAYDLLMTVGATKSAQVRYTLLNEIDAGAMFHGVYPSDIPILRHFLNDRSKKVRDLAQKKLESAWGNETEEDHARILIKYFSEAKDGKIMVSSDFFTSSLMMHCLSTSLDALANLLSIGEIDLVSRIDLQQLQGDLYMLFMRTDNPKAKTILADRMTAADFQIPKILVPHLSENKYQDALQIAFQSEFPSTIFDFLGMKAGTLEMSSIRQIKHYPSLVPTVVDELTKGVLPVNQSYDPLRILAFLASKDAAVELIDEALDAGMAADNPRLTMLKLNLAL